MNVLDANSEHLGVSIDTLMDNAGKAIAEVVSERYGKKKILIVCGNGNNGGDGFAAANHLEGCKVTVMRVSSDRPPRSYAAKRQFWRLKCPVLDFDAASLKEYDVLIDCAVGIGAEGELKEPYASCVKAIRGFKGTVISADIPSGNVVPSITVTFHDMKEGMTPANSGEIIVKDIGIPDKAFTHIGPGDMLRYPIPKFDSHKGCNGTLLIIGGGPYAGAPSMAALAAMRTGADLVKIAVPASVCDIVASFCPVFVMDKLVGSVLGPGHVEELLTLSKLCDAVLIGPGLGLDEMTIMAVNEFVRRCEKPLVIDADGLNSLGKSFKNPNGRPVILTPHSREFLRLGGIMGKDHAASVSAKASESNTVILLKGAEDIISDGKKTKFNDTGTSAMTSAGTGDVLAGIVAALLAKGMSAFDAACLGAYISGRAGEYAFAVRSYGMIATDVIDHITSVFVNELE